MDLLNNNKIVTGIAMLMLNIGARYIQADLGKAHEMLLSNEYVKKIIVFCMFFVATRDVAIAFLLTIFYIIIIDGMLHEKRKFCIVPKKFIDTKEVSDIDYKKAQEIIRTYQETKIKQESKPNNNYENYINNITII
jgi:hypothetical protein